MNKQKFRLSDYDGTIREVLESGGEFRIYPSGTSMLPLLRQGLDSVSLVKPSGQLKNNDIAFYIRENGSYVLHRVIKSHDGVYTMCGDNQVTLEKDIDHSRIIGVVSKIFRNDKPFNMKGAGYRIYLLLWRSFFLRRVFFKLRNIFGKRK
ncbi:MAG: S24/S26 family peptidase [Ruminiclostridium sp.]|nr:S24/S26 family peptidase [Ruminiclostridium sp.]